MGVPGFGFSSYVQFTREATFATPPTILKRLPARSIDPRPEMGIVRSASLGGTVTRPAIYGGGIRAGLVLEFDLFYENFNMLLDMAMGTANYGSNGGSTAGPVSTIYTHTLKQKALMNSATFELVEGNIPAGACQRLLGGKTTELVISGQAAFDGADDILKARMTFAGKQYQTNQPLTGALSAPTPTPILFHHATTVDLGSGDATTVNGCRSFELAIKNNLAADRFYMGSQYPDEPMRNSYADSSLKFVAEFQTRLALDKYLAVTQAAPIITFTDPAQAGRLFTISMPKGYITAHSHPIQGPDIVTQEFSWEAIDDAGGTPSGVTIVVANTQATITT